MRRRGLPLLLAITLVLVGAAVAVLVGDDRTVSRPARPEPVFPGLAAHLGDLAWMRIAHGGTVIDLNLIAGHWAVVEKGNYPAAAGKVRRLLAELADLTLIEPKTAQPELLPRLDLDDPANGKSTELRVQDRTGRTVGELIVGRVRRDRLGGGNDGVYVRRLGEAQAWLARGSLDLPPDAVGWLDRRIIDLPAARVASLILTAADGSLLSLRRERPQDKLAIGERLDEVKAKADAVVAAPAAALAALDLDDVKPAAELPLPPRGVATASVTTFDGLTVQLRLFAAGERDWASFTAAGSDGGESAAAAINTRLARWVYAIPAARAGLLRTRLADLVAPADDR